MGLNFRYVPSILLVSNLAILVECNSPVAFVTSQVYLIRGAFKESSSNHAREHQRKCATCLPALQMAVSGGGERRGPGGTRKDSRGGEPVVEKIGKVQAIRQRKGEATGIRGSVKTQGRKWDNITPVPPSIRVSSGTAKGRKLNSPDVYLRPMMGKVRFRFPASIRVPIIRRRGRGCR